MRGMEPGGREPAPGALRLVQAFVNTVDLEDGPDRLARPEGLSEWLVETGLLAAPAPIDGEDLARAVAVREDLRLLALANNDAGVRSQDVLTRLGETADRAELTLRFDVSGGSSLVPAAAGLDAALGSLLAVVHAASADGSWFRLKACLNDACRWAFYDHSRNRAGRWCTMEICGNRSKARRAYRARRGR
jgi:predicted RNA-binding Zn ribbon-like protein